MAIAYTPIGDMTRQVDFWDQPSQPKPDGSEQDPVPFSQGVWCKIEGLWAVTQARKLAQQVVNEISHRITIRYMRGLRSRMFILYNDPDSQDDQGNLVPRRFDIDSIIDPDENKVEQQLLCIERNDGQ